ncbi:Ig-like domain-containing protein [Filimonas effusa]|uniref:SbsA Ig-like domain-containing protein n=1 Tax=Filimonas effusa TaxID=2508721 RepID=A0A4Q1D469_9BACT|nr:Ig-like domain-containing protein [Filimonas effusa]RXK81983.1 hypothetical protein ESB13_19585 [Filimonas effusa]
MRKRSYIFYFLMLAVLGSYVSSVSSCANIIPPGGGPKDSLAPVLLSAVPKDSTRHFSGNRIVLHFDEYVTLDNTQENVIVSPNAKNIPQIEGKLRTVTIRLKDSLEANTTYSINFGKSIKDVNEGNIAKEFTYVFSTGSTIDSCYLEGTVQLAQTGKIDSTLIVVLHNNLNDTAVSRSRPRYYAKLDGHGHFRFNNLPPAKFAVYAIPNDYNKRYDDSTKLFAFLDSSVTVNVNTPAIKLYAFQEYLEKPKATRSQQSSGNNKKKNKDKEKEEDKRLKITGTSLSAGEQDILTPLFLGFNRPLKSFDSSKMVLADTNYKPLPVQPHFTWTDTTATKITLTYPWKAETELRLMIDKEAATDSGGTNIHKSDTIDFKVKKESAYGSIKFHFNGIDLERHPVLQILQSDKVVDSIAIRDKSWSRRLYAPGDYELRILYDKNQDGKWTPGRFWESAEKEQPELVYPAKPGKVTVRGNWDNEWDITQGDPFEVPEQKKPTGRPGQRPPGK